jgi:hypothetical protein
MSQIATYPYLYNRHSKDDFLGKELKNADLYSLKFKKSSKVDQII